ncbi:pentapeptide repeat-containing protein [Pasteurella multocida]|uniref:pentapeptide repeat-containing protein n=1 Tax=Pasteurella multocida TaxID=747 RepID=UPI002B4B9858|nr:pentapeptide repeat-containing protein [Pasteurella multocida]
MQYPEVFPNLCLAGMDFHLPGLDKNVLSLFINIKNCSGINLIAANLHSARLDGARLVRARLDGARLVRASLDGARLDGARLDGARLDGARLGGARLYGARLDGAIFTYNTDSDINWADLKSKGGVILYFTASERKRDIRMQLVKAEAKFFHYVLDNIDIEKTQQENPDWKIFIIK